MRICDLQKSFPSPGLFYWLVIFFRHSVQPHFLFRKMNLSYFHGLVITSHITFLILSIQYNSLYLGKQVIFSRKGDSNKTIKFLPANYVLGDHQFEYCCLCIWDPFICPYFHHNNLKLILNLTVIVTKCWSRGTFVVAYVHICCDLRTRKKCQQTKFSSNI